MRYHEVRNYGFNHIVRQYANFPWYLPLPAHMEHGWTCYDNALRSDLKTDKPLMLVFNKHRKAVWKKESNVPVAVIGAPFIHYKNINNITRKRNAAGTVAFPSHSTFEVKSKYDIKNYCQVLKNLPKEYQPVTVCLFYLDYIDDRAKIYRENGFTVVTSGPKFTDSLGFAKKFYQILSSHRYATSNTIGSYTLYAVDMGIPFFLTGKKSKLVNIANKDINVREASKRGEPALHKEAVALFSTGPVKKIVESQRKFVREQTGIDDCLDPKGLNRLLWKTFRDNKYWSKAVLPYLISIIYYKLVFNAPWTGLLIRLRKKISDINII